MRYIRPDDRMQIQTNFGCLDDVIEKNNMVRVIDYFINHLDVRELGFTKSVPHSLGRKPYNPKDLLKLYIYGYMNRIQTSRWLEKETKRNLEVKWLLGNLSPDFKTIADFRKENRSVLKKVFREFSYLCKSADLIDFKLTAIDGSYFSAVNHNSKNYSKKKLIAMLKRIDEKIEFYLNEIQRVDQNDFTREIDLDDQLQRLQKKKAEYQMLQKMIETSGGTQVSVTDPDSRMMSKAQSKMDMSYNVQTAVDSKHNLIVDYEVTNANTDSHQLSFMAEQVKTTYGLDALSVTADSAYGSGEELAKCKEMNVETFVSIQEQRKSNDLGRFSSKYFEYDKTTDTFTCPMGKQLPHCAHITSKKTNVYGSINACRGCSSLSLCVTSKAKYRKVYRTDFADVVEEQKEINKKNKDKISLRKMIVEHPFGTIKHHMKFTGFLTKRFPMVNGEFGLVALSYNIKRVFNILGFDKFMEAIQRYYCVRTSEIKEKGACYHYFCSFFACVEAK